MKIRGFAKLSDVSSAAETLRRKRGRFAKHTLTGRLGSERGNSLRAFPFLEGVGEEECLNDGYALKGKGSKRK